MTKTYRIMILGILLIYGVFWFYNRKNVFFGLNDFEFFFGHLKNNFELNDISLLTKIKHKRNCTK